jgi:hypothetical protein
MKLLKMPDGKDDAECIKQACDKCHEVGRMCAAAPRVMCLTTNYRKIHDIIIRIHAAASCTRLNAIEALAPFVEMFVPINIPARMALAVAWHADRQQMIDKWKISPEDVACDAAAFKQNGWERPIDHWAYRPYVPKELLWMGDVVPIFC